MTDTYTFTVVLGDSDDEFSETFNPKDRAGIRNLEDFVFKVLDDGCLNPVTVRLEQVTVDVTL